MKEKFINFGIFLFVFLLSVGFTLATVSNYITVSGTATVIVTTTTTTSSTTTESTTIEVTTTPIETTTTISLVNHVVFSEVFYDTPETESEEEWIEFYNPTVDSIDLSGLTIEDGAANSYSIPNGAIIASGEFLIIARDDTGFWNLYGFSPDVSDLNFGLNNDGDVLKLKNDDVEIDMVAWKNYVSGWNLESSESESIQRYPSNIDTDTVNDWISHTTPNPGD